MCLLKWVFSQATQARGQIHRSKIAKALKRWKDCLHLQQQPALHLNRRLSIAITAELTESKANCSRLKACLSFLASFQTSHSPMWDLHTTIKPSICQSNGEKGMLCCLLNSSFSGYCILYTSILNNSSGNRLAVFSAFVYTATTLQSYKLLTKCTGHLHFKLYTLRIQHKYETKWRLQEMPRILFVTNMLNTKCNISIIMLAIALDHMLSEQKKFRSIN